MLYTDGATDAPVENATRQEVERYEALRQYLAARRLGDVPVYGVVVPPVAISSSTWKT